MCDGKLIFDSYCLIVDEHKQYKYQFLPPPFLPYHGVGGTVMSKCCDSPTHIFDEHHPFPLPHMAEDNVEEVKSTFEARLIIANEFSPSQAYLATNACHGLHATIYACH
eukprot:6183603-Pleurochrysis_carterae.AAC.1